jgi:hypothetical protein
MRAYIGLQHSPYPDRAAEIKLGKPIQAKNKLCFAASAQTKLSSNKTLANARPHDPPGGKRRSSIRQSNLVGLI